MYLSRHDFTIGLKWLVIEINFIFAKGASLICNEVMEILEQNKDSKINSNTDKVKSYSPLVIGLYYDDPESVPEEELRYAVGAVLSKGKFKSKFIKYILSESMKA